LIERSQDIEEWQGPLVHRPSLNNHAAQRLAEFVAENLLESLKSRDDLSPKTLSIVRKEVNRRLEVSHKAKPQKINYDDEGGTNKELRDEYGWLFQQPPHVIAQNLSRMNRLTPQVIANALHEGDYDFVIAGLAERAGIHMSVAQRMIAMRSARGITALCWKAEMKAKCAVRIQAKAAHIPLDDIVLDSDDDYTMTEEELQWQIDFFANMAV